MCKEILSLVHCTDNLYLNQLACNNMVGSPTKNTVKNFD